jgi:hypothetical protein
MSEGEGKAGCPISRVLCEKWDPLPLPFPPLDASDASKLVFSMETCTTIQWAGLFFA